MINTLTMMMRRFPFKNQLLDRQANIVTSCQPKKKIVRQTKDGRTDFCPSSVDEPTPQL